MQGPLYVYMYSYLLLQNMCNTELHAYHTKYLVPSYNYLYSLPVNSLVFARINVCVF